MHVIQFYIFFDSNIQKKKQKKDPLLLKKSKNDPNAPPLNRIPIPEL